jgi:adenylyltransferase/sulfurtransferase
MNALSHATLHSIYCHASDAYPEECCGFVFADGSVHAGDNIQNDLHRQNPTLYQRSAANGFTFSAKDTVLLYESFRGTNPVSVIYHSHPDVGAYFSREDQDRALFGGQPIHRVAYLVVDVREKAVSGAKVFEWTHGGFHCSHEFIEEISATQKERFT